MSYCINPNCPNFNAPANQPNCSNCGLGILLQERYGVIRSLGGGGFGKTFEVEDVKYSARKKVLKVLHINDKKAVDLFEREADVLKRLNHPGIPRVEPDGYFKLWPKDSQEPLHCLVMEYIDGIDLKDWLSRRNNQPITSKQAFDWLKQLAEILDKLHERNYWHRDIKPSNIMLRPDNQLVLIDFGAVKEATETYLLEQEKKPSATVIISQGYTPPEQAIGSAVRQSDFYALGRTFVHLLTGTSPRELAENSQTGKLNWRNNAPQGSKELADLIDDMMAEKPDKRPINAQRILQRLGQMPTQVSSGNISSSEPTTRTPNSPNKKLALVLGGSAILLSLAGALSYLLKTPSACDGKTGEHLSCGEEVLITPSYAGQFKQEAVKQFAQGKYSEAVSLLEKARSEKPNDPETLIYLNNAKLGDRPAYTIAVAAPITTNLDTAAAMLRGVAQAQDEVNHGKKINGQGLKVLIADDFNQPTQAKRIADALVAKQDILAVIGSYASEVTLAALPVYQQHQLVLISPSSTSEDLTAKGKDPNHVFFRTVPNNKMNAKKLAEYLLKKFAQTTSVVLYSANSNYSNSIQRDFEDIFNFYGGKVLKKVDLCGNPSSVGEALDSARKQPHTALVLFPDGKTCHDSFKNVLHLISANRGKYKMAGAWSLYDTEILDRGSDVVDKLVLAVPWHRLSSPNAKFPKSAKKLWKGEVGGVTATSYDAARALITALEKQSNPTRFGMQQTLAASDFKADGGATGEVSFDGGDRKEPIVELVKVVPKCSGAGYTFVPVNYATDPECPTPSP